MDLGSVLKVAIVAAIMGMMAGMMPQPQLPYSCPYCSERFATYEELVEHVVSGHPGERIPIEIVWS